MMPIVFSGLQLLSRKYRNACKAHNWNSFPSGLYHHNILYVYLLAILEDIALNNGASHDDVPDECLSIKERYENAVRKSCVYSNIVKNEILEITGIQDFG